MATGEAKKNGSMNSQSAAISGTVSILLGPNPAKAAIGAGFERNYW